MHAAVRTALLALATLGVGMSACESTPRPSGSDRGAAPGRGPAPRSTDVSSWAEVLERAPDPAVVTDGSLRARIEASGLPWRVRDRATGIEMLLVPAGSFVMGKSPGDAQAFAGELPAHEVTLTRPFYLGRHEVMQGEWMRTMGSNPSRFRDAPRDRDREVARLMEQGMTRQEAEAKVPEVEASGLPIVRLPVDSVSWEDCERFCRKSGLRLPTEAEWEFAARAGVRGARHGEVDLVAWHAGNALARAREIGQKQPNALGFHDMLGNLWEWCSDWYDGNAYADREMGAADPAGPDEGDFKVVRGGSWDVDAGSARASHRGDVTPDYANSSFGVRMARDP